MFQEVTASRVIWSSDIGGMSKGGTSMNDWNRNGSYDSSDRYIDYKLSGGGSSGGSGGGSNGGGSGVLIWFFVALDFNNAAKINITLLMFGMIMFISIIITDLYEAFFLSQDVVKDICVDFRRRYGRYKDTE